MLAVKIGLVVVGRVPVWGNEPGLVVVVVVVGGVVVVVDGTVRTGAVVVPARAVAETVLGPPPLPACAISTPAPVTATQATASAVRVRRRRNTHRRKRFALRSDPVNAEVSAKPSSQR